MSNTISNSYIAWFVKRSVFLSEFFFSNGKKFVCRSFFVTIRHFMPHDFLSMESVFRSVMILFRESSSLAVRCWNCNELTFCLGQAGTSSGIDLGSIRDESSLVKHKNLWREWSSWFCCAGECVDLGAVGKFERLLVLRCLLRAQSGWHVVNHDLNLSNHLLCWWLVLGNDNNCEEVPEDHVSKAIASNDGRYSGLSSFDNTDVPVLQELLDTLFLLEIVHDERLWPISFCQNLAILLKKINRVLLAPDYFLYSKLLS